MSGGQVIRGIWERGQGSVDAAAAVIRGWVQGGKIAPVEPMYLMFNIWAMTQHYADYEAQVRFFTHCPPGKPLDRETICQEITGLILRGVGLAYPQPAVAAARANGGPDNNAKPRQAPPASPLRTYASWKRIGDMVYMSVIAVELLEWPRGRVF